MLFRIRHIGFVYRTRNCFMRQCNFQLQIWKSLKAKKWRGGLGRNSCLFVTPWKTDALIHSLIKSELSQYFILHVKLFYKLLCGYRCISHDCYRKFFLCFFTTFSWSAPISLENELYTDSLFLLSSPNVIFQFSFWNEIIDYLKIILPFFQSSSSSLMTKLPLMSHFIFFFWWRSSFGTLLQRDSLSWGLGKYLPFFVIWLPELCFSAKNLGVVDKHLFFHPNSKTS